MHILQLRSAADLLEARASWRLLHKLDIALVPIYYIYYIRATIRRHASSSQRVIYIVNIVTTLLNIPPVRAGPVTG